jgi:hypothetical protein
MKLESENLALDLLSDQIGKCQNVNVGIIIPCFLHFTYRSLLQQLKKLQSLFSATTGRTAQASTCMLVLVMSFALLIFPSINPFKRNDTLALLNVNHQPMRGKRIWLMTWEYCNRWIFMGINLCTGETTKQHWNNLYWSWLKGMNIPLFISVLLDTVTSLFVALLIA